MSDVFVINGRLLRGDIGLFYEHLKLSPYQTGGINHFDSRPVFPGILRSTWDNPDGYISRERDPSCAPTMRTCQIRRGENLHERATRAASRRRHLAGQDNNRSSGSSRSSQREDALENPGAFHARQIINLRELFTY